MFKTPILSLSVLPPPNPSNTWSNTLSFVNLGIWLGFVVCPLPWHGALLAGELDLICFVSMLRTEPDILVKKHLCRVNDFTSVLTASPTMFSFLWPESHLHIHRTFPVPKHGLCFPCMTLPPGGTGDVTEVQGRRELCLCSRIILGFL